MIENIYYRWANALFPEFSWFWKLKLLPEFSGIATRNYLAVLT